MDENNVGRTERPERPARSRKKRRGGAGRTVAKVIGTLVLMGITTCAFLACFAAVYIKTVILPQATLDLDDYTLGENSVMYYQDKDTGEYRELATVATDTSSIWVDYDEIPEYLVKATIAIEDKRFLEHHGVDWKRTAAAILYMFTGQDIQGGSTITQQLIKNLTEEDDVTVKRKVTEIFKALEFDRNHSKEDTITYYLNVIYLGSGCKGVGSASYKYFGKPVSELTLAECASLISITNNPSLYSPYSTYSYVDEETGETVTALDLNKRRQELVLSEMLKQGKISQAEHDEAVAQPLDFHSAEGATDVGAVYSWYEEQVLDDVRDDLIASGYTEDAANLLLSKGGLKILTCLDPEVQALAESVYQDRENLNYTSSSGQTMQSAITIIDNETGDVAAIVGSVGEKTANRGWNYASHTLRQPGSSFKPLAVYAPALEMDLITPGSVVDDYPYQVLGGRAWPVNSGAAHYRGLTTIYSALTRSVNTVAVRLLADYVTPSASFEFVRDKFHITSLVESMEINGQVYNDYGLSQLGLGGLTTGVNTLEMAAAYAAFPNNGVYSNPRTYTQVLGRDDNVVLDNAKESEVILKESTAFYINYMLENVVNSGTGTAANFSNSMGVAGKTGTTSDDYDRWFAGYTPYYTAVVWTGYPNAERMRTNGNPAVTMWRKVMEPLHEVLENRAFDRPDGVVSTEICADSGMLMTDACRADPRGSRGTGSLFMRDDVPSEYCTIHTEVQVCTECPILDAEGNETGLYHLAGEFCPAESVITVGLLNYERADVGGATTDDAIYLLSYTEAAGPCTTHTAEHPGGITGGFDPLDPNTWPTDDPNFNIFDPSTWPTNDPDPQPSESGDPSVDPSPSPSGGETPAPSPSPSASPSPSPSPSGGGESQPGESPSGTVPAN